MTATAQRSARAAPLQSELARRTVVGLLLAAVVFGSLANSAAFALIVLFVTLGSLHELSALSRRAGQGMIFPVAAAGTAAYILLASVGWQHVYVYEKPLIVAIVVASLLFSLRGPRDGFFSRSAFTVFGVFYIGWLGSYFVVLRNLPGVGVAYTAAAIVLIALTDIFAMLVGTTLGRTPLTSISPKKTWEGAIGGLVATTIAATSFAMAGGVGFPWWQGAVIGIFTSVAAQAGDIVESALKRDARVKDAGTFFAGHGGILDRFDSYTFGGIAFYAALFVTHHIPK